MLSARLGQSSRTPVMLALAQLVRSAFDLSEAVGRCNIRLLSQERLQPTLGPEFYLRTDALLVVILSP